MLDIEAEIRGLKKPEPGARFCRNAKNRLMNRIEMYENESFFVKTLRKLSPIFPSDAFVQSAKVRLMARISAAKQPLAGWLIFTKRIIASTLVMVIAVTSVLFATGNKQPVSASENSYLEIESGSVAIKHADKIIWDVITKQTELSEGDLIQLGADDKAVVHFFDDTEARLDGNSVVLINKMKISPGYARQGVIEMSLHQGRMWVQTLNVDDGAALFSVITPDSIISTTNASFDIKANLTDPTLVRTFRRGVNISAILPDSQKVFATGKLNSLQQVYINSPNSFSGATTLASFAKIMDISDTDRGDAWVQKNMQSDRSHLAQIRERELMDIKSAAGSLPGDMFYPLKRAKENLALALSFNQESQANAQIDIANQRLNEAIILTENGETDKAKQALAEYQDLVRQITAEKGDNTGLAQISTKVIAARQKTLIAALPSDSQIGIVKQVLDQTEEMLAEDPIKKADIRLKNSMDDLVHIQDFINSGDYAAAQEALTKHQSIAQSLLAEVTDFQDDAQKKDFYTKIIDNQNEERRILGEITRTLSSNEVPADLLEIAKNTDRVLNDGIKYVTSTASPLIVDAQMNATLSADQKKLNEFVEKIAIYSTWTGQKNQIDKLLSQNPSYAADMDFLVRLRDKVDTRTQDLINAKIIALKADKIEARGKRIQMKINRAKQQMEMRAVK